MRATFVIITLFCLIPLLPAEPASAARALTMYLDGAIVEQAVSTGKGYLEILLPPGARVDSLRIKPQAGTDIVRVITEPLLPTRKQDKELASLAEREELLQDRLKALATREDVFKSAAKSQSAKAPRKTKTNPEPLQSIRQGTDYAIAQLEAVYNSRRRAEKELGQLREKRSRLKSSAQVGGTLAKIWLAASSGAVTARYLQTDRFWNPSYDLRASSDGKAKLFIFPHGVALLPGETARVVLAPVESQKSSESWKFVAPGSALNVIELAATRKAVPDPVFPPLSLLLTNSTERAIPPGDLSCYLDGEYFGAGRFPGIEAAKSLQLECPAH